MNSNELCPICLEELELNIYITNCKHKLHEKCYKNLIEYETNQNKKDVLCPLCKKIIHENTFLIQQQQPMYIVVEIPNNNQRIIQNKNNCGFFISIICLGIIGFGLWYTDTMSI
jgi:hypothetical protein